MTGPALLERRSDDEAARLVSDHCIDDVRLTAYASLAQSRGVDLEAVIRAAMRGDLRDIVKLPPRTAERT